jgi:hypothetical protein
MGPCYYIIAGLSNYTQGAIVARSPSGTVDLVELGNDPNQWSVNAQLSFVNFVI